MRMWKPGAQDFRKRDNQKYLNITSSCALFAVFGLETRAQSEVLHCRVRLRAVVKGALSRVCTKHRSRTSPQGPSIQHNFLFDMSPRFCFQKCTLSWFLCTKSTVWKTNGSANNATKAELLAELLSQRFTIASQVNVVCDITNFWTAHLPWR